MTRKSKLPVVTDLDAPPEIGRYYMVPTIGAYWADYYSDWPVIGPPHSDREFFNFHPLHYHLDLRFMTQAQIAVVDRRWAHRPWHVNAYGSPLHINDANRWLPEPVLQKRRCCRDWPPSPFRGALGHRYAEFEDAYEADRLRPGMICPHRGVCLKSIPVAADGTVECPAHGLRWNAQSGRLVRKTEPSAGEPA